MTVLSPTADRLAHLERIGARLRQADAEAAAIAARHVTLGYDDLHHAAEVCLLATIDARDALDGAWSVDARAAGLLRAVAEQCAIEASETLRTGPVRPCLYDAARLLRQASDLLARVANERARENEQQRSAA